MHQIRTRRRKKFSVLYRGLFAIAIAVATATAIHVYPGENQTALADGPAEQIEEIVEFIEEQVSQPITQLGSAAAGAKIGQEVFGRRCVAPGALVGALVPSEKARENFVESAVELAETGQQAVETATEVASDVAETVSDALSVPPSDPGPTEIQPAPETSNSACRTETSVTRVTHVHFIDGERYELYSTETTSVLVCD